MAEDKDGVIWMATSVGLVRYDGYHFKSYSVNDYKENGPISNLMEAIFIDSRGNIWLGFHRSGLCKFDPTTEIFTNYPYEPENKRGPLSRKVVSFLEDSKGNLWVADRKGILKYNQETDDFRQIKYDPENKNGLSQESVNQIYEDSYGRIWVATGPFFAPEGNTGGLNLFDPEKETFTHYFHDPEDSTTLSHNIVTALLEDSRGNFWVGTDKNGLHLMDRENGTFRRMEYDPKHPEKLAAAPGSGGMFNGVRFITEDSGGKIWISYLFQGLSVYDPETEKMTHLIGEEKERAGIEDYGLHGFCNLSSGELLISSGEGNIYSYHPKKNITQLGKTDKWVSCILETSENETWMGTQNGVLIYEFDEKGYHPVKKDNPWPDKLQNSPIYHMVEDEELVYWLGTYEGLWRFDKKTMEFEFFEHATLLPNDTISGPVFHLFLDRDNNLWTNTLDGLFLFDKTNKTFKLVELGPNSSTRGFRIMTAFEDSHGNFWVPTITRGLYLLDKNTLSVDRKIPEMEYFIDITEARDGRVLFGTYDNGIIVYDHEMDEFYPLEDPISGVRQDYRVNSFHNIGDHIWVYHAKGIVIYDQDLRMIQSLGEEIGIPTSKMGKITHLDRTGHLNFMTEKGIVQLDTKMPFPVPYPPNLIFSDFKLFGKSHKNGFNGTDGKPINEAESIVLPHDQNFFTFDFAGIHYLKPEDNRHFFQLENYDLDWRETETTNSASYSQVLPGEYVFRVKAMSSDGMWAERAIPITVLPPWWKTWWAYVSYGLLAVGMGVGIRKYTQGKERLRHDLEIQRLEALRARELDQTKSRFFANLSHEFRTPLTLISGPLQRFLQRTPKAHPDHRVYRIMQRNVELLLNLINQLLDLSKLEAGHMQLRSQKVVVRDFLPSIFAPFLLCAEQKRIAFVQNISCPGAMISTDADKLSKILNNLLSNAFKFTPESGKVEVSIWISRASFPEAKGNSKNHFLHLRVKDNGKGIPKEQQKFIFDRFFQVDSSHTRDQEGTGIGLSLVKELVQLLGGNVEVESSPGQGSTFEVNMPIELLINIKEATMQHNFHYPKLELKETEKLENLQGEGREQPSLLIVEDNADLRKFIAKILRDDFLVLQAQDGENGLEKAKKHIPDIILSDVMMPKMDGISMCKSLKQNQHTSHIPLLLLTAKADKAHKIDGLKSGADDYLVKPFDMDELLLKVSNLVSRTKAIKEKWRKEIEEGKPIEAEPASKDQSFIKRAKTIVEEHLHREDFNLEFFCRELGMSRTQAFRKFRGLADMPPGDFIRMVKLQKAKSLLKEGKSSIAEVAYQLGFQDPSYFTKVFQKHYGTTPSAYLNQDS